jgi:hypothetical protein
VSVVHPWIAEAHRQIDAETDQCADELWHALCQSGIAEDDRDVLMQECYRALDAARDRVRARVDAFAPRLATMH